jgi:hypothetical protein
MDGRWAARRVGMISAPTCKFRPEGARWWDDAVAALLGCAPTVSQGAIVAVRRVLGSLASDAAGDQTTVSDAGTLPDTVGRS